MAVGGTRSSQAYHPMTIALLGRRAQTPSTKHGGRLSSPASTLYASSKRELSVQPLARSIDWGLSRQSMWTDPGTIPRALTHFVGDAGKSQNDPIELSSDEDDDDEDEKDEKEEEEEEEEEEEGIDDYQSTPLQRAARAGEGTTGSKPDNAYVDAPSALIIDHGAEYQHSKAFNAEDLSQANDEELHNLLVQAQRVNEDDQDDQEDAAQSIQMPKIAVDEEGVQYVPNRKSSKSSAGKTVDRLLQNILDEDLLAVQEASQVRYDGAARQRRSAWTADLIVGPNSPMEGDGNDSVNGVPIERDQTSTMTEDSKPELPKAEEEGIFKMDIKQERVKYIQDPGTRTERVEDITIGDVQAAIPTYHELKQDVSEQERRVAQQRKKTAAFVERRRLLDLDKAEQLKKAEADRALKSQKDPEKTGKSLATQVLRAQRERERLKAGVVAKDLSKVAGIGEKHCVPSRPTQPNLANRATAGVLITAASSLATASVTTSASAPASARATVSKTVPTTSRATPPNAPPTAKATTWATIPATAWVTVPATAPVATPPATPTTIPVALPATVPATSRTTSSANTIRDAPRATTSVSNSGPSSSQQSAAVIGKCAADEPPKENKRASPVPLQDAEDYLRTSLEGCEKRKRHSAMLSFEKHIEGTAPKKARSNESTSKPRIGDVVPPRRPSFGYTGTARSPSATPSGIASPGSRKTRMTTPERKEAKRLSSVKHRIKKAQERALAQNAGSRGSTASLDKTSSYTSPSVSGSHDGDGETGSSSVRMGFAALSKVSPSPSNGNVNIPEPVSQKVHTEGNSRSRNSGLNRDRRQEYQRPKERQRLEKEKKTQSGLGSAITSSTTTADLDPNNEILFDTMDPMQVDSEPEEAPPRPTTGGKTITPEMLAILQQKPSSLLSFIDDSLPQEPDEDTTYYEYTVQRLSWPAASSSSSSSSSSSDDPEPLLCATGFIDVDAANAAAAAEILLERPPTRIHPLEAFQWTKDPATGMATYEGSSATGHVRVFVERAVRPRGGGRVPLRRALRAARRISPAVWVVLGRDIAVGGCGSKGAGDGDGDADADAEVEDEELVGDGRLAAAAAARNAKPVVKLTVEVCRTRDLANKLASKYVLERLRAYRRKGELGEIERAEDEAEQRKYLEQLEEVEGTYFMEAELPERGGFLDVWVEKQGLRGPCN